MKSLGNTLKEARELIPFTLRQVEDATEISTAYLSQLENDKIKKPSANVLYKLANFYKIDLNTLLVAAGIVEKSKTDPGEDARAANEFINRVAFMADNFTEEQKAEIFEYIKYLKFKSNNARPSIEEGH